MRLRAALSLTAGALLGASALLLIPSLSGAGHAAEQPPAPATAAPGAALLEPLSYNPSLSLAPLVEQMGPAVVNIHVSQTVEFGGMDLRGVPAPFRDLLPYGGQGGSQERKGQGSGFILSQDGTILTNHHVVDGADTVTVTLSDDREYSARVVGSDPHTDVALVQIEGAKDLPTVRLGSSEALRVGDWVVAIGNPFGLDHTVTAGIVSGKGREIGAGPYDQFIQTDASINPGNSGGPLFNLRGEVVGINTAIVGQGIGFAVPIDLVKEMLEDLRTDGKVARGWVGVGLQDLDPALARRLGADGQKGAVLSQVYADTPASKAGLRPGDLVVALDGAPVKDSGAVVRAIGSKRPGEKVSLEILRDGRNKQVQVELGRRPDEGAPPQALAEGREPRSDSDDALSRLGFAGRDAASVGIQAKAGVVVTRVDPDGAAAERLRAGDLIIEANGLPVKDHKDLRRALSGDDGLILLVVERRGAQHLIELHLD